MHPGCTNRTARLLALRTRHGLFIRPPGCSRSAGRSGPLCGRRFRPPLLHQCAAGIHSFLRHRPYRRMRTSARQYTISRCSRRLPRCLTLMRILYGPSSTSAPLARSSSIFSASLVSSFSNSSCFCRSSRSIFNRCCDISRGFSRGSTCNCAIGQLSRCSDCGSHEN